MKKFVTLLLTGVLSLSLVACNNGAKEETVSKKEEKTEKVETLKIGASNVPHSEILEKAQPILKEQGVELEIIPFQDYVLPNKALQSEDIDANYFQHIPYLEAQMKENKYEFENAGGIHIEPIGIYSKRYKTLDELPKGAKIIMSNSVADHGRILTLLQQEGLIKIKDGIDNTTATLDDIVENPKNLEFEAEVEAGLLASLYNNDEGDALLINTNYAIDAGLNPLKDAIAIEGSESPYVNIITVRKGDKNKESIKKLVEVLHSKEIQDFILKEYKGAVVPVK